MNKIIQTKYLKVKQLKSGQCRFFLRGFENKWYEACRSVDLTGGMSEYEEVLEHLIDLAKEAKTHE